MRRSCSTGAPAPVKTLRNSGSVGCLGQGISENESLGFAPPSGAWSYDLLPSKTMNQLLAELTARAALPLGLLFLLTYNVWVLKNLRHRWMLLDLLGLFAVLQLWVAPALRYHFEDLGWTLDPNNNMAVPAEVYFPVVVPMVLALVLGLRGPTLRWDNKGVMLRWEGLPRFFGTTTQSMPLSVESTRKGRPYMPWILLGLGLVGLLVYPYAQPFLKQPCVLLKGLLWVAAAYGVLVIPAKRGNSGMTRGYGFSRFAWMTSVAVLALDAITTTFFGDFVLGMVFLGMVWLYGRPYPWVRLLAVQVVGAVLVVFLLSFKFEYRKAVKAASADVPERFGLFFSTAWDALTPPYSWLGADVALERLNQGMYVARVMAYVPENAPHGYGHELGGAFLAAFVPRFLWPGKHMAGGQLNRERFLGVPQSTYSYNIGPVGEAWAHFGRWGWMYCFVYAWSLQQLQQLLLVGSRRWFAPLWLFSFYLFAPALLTEGDSGIVWNHLVKAGIITFMLVLVFNVLSRQSKKGTPS